MASRKPLVIVNGRIQQLQPSDTLDAVVSEVDLTIKNNANAGAIVIGMPVYPSASGSVDKAKADAIATAEPIGIVRDPSVAAGQPAAIQTDGVLVATTGQWDVVTGQVGGLTPGAEYYLSETTAGHITSTAPTASGKFVTRMGRALSETDLEITIEQSIGL